MSTKPKNQDIAEAFYKYKVLDENDKVILDVKKDVLYCRGWDLFYRWQGGWYLKLDERFEMRKWVYSFLRLHFDFINITEGLVKDIIVQFKWQVQRIKETMESKYIAFKDVLLDTSDMTTHEFNRNKVSTFYLPYKYKDLHEMPIPIFKNFLNTSLVMKDNSEEPDQDLILFVQEMFGYFLLDNLKAAAAFFLVGDGQNGKSVMAKIIQDIIGEKFCSAMSIQTLTTDKFSTQHLIGKRVNISNEEESKFIRSDKFKALITGEMISAERKFGDAFEFMPKTKYIFASNKLPTFDAINYGLRRRMKIVPFYKVFKPTEKDINLSEKLLEEYPGIIWWALEGAKRLIKNEYNFSWSDSSNKALRRFEAEVSSALKFIYDNYIIDDESWVAGDHLYEEYNEWCQKNGKKAKNKFGFLADVSENNIDGLKITRGSHNNIRVRGRNLRLKTALDREKEDEHLEDGDGGDEEVDVDKMKF